MADKYIHQRWVHHWGCSLPRGLPGDPNMRCSRCGIEQKPRFIGRGPSLYRRPGGEWKTGYTPCPKKRVTDEELKQFMVDIGFIQGEELRIRVDVRIRVSAPPVDVRIRVNAPQKAE